MGMSAAEVPALVARFEAAATPIVEVLSKDSPLYCEEGLALCGIDTICTATARGATIAELPAIAQESAICMETTGATLSGSSANFMTGIYQFLTTNQVSAQFLMSNADFFTTFFSWLGADLAQFDDLPSGVGGDAVVSYGDQVFPMVFGSYPFDDLYPAKPWLNDTNWLFYYISNGNGKLTVVYPTYPGSSDVASAVNICLAPNGAVFSLDGYKDYGLRYDTVSIENDGHLVSMYTYYSYVGKFEEKTFNPSLGYNYLAPDGTDYATYDPLSGWTGNVSVGESSTSFAGQIIGADAQYDDAGNITDYGNVTVPNVFAPDYTVPGSYAEALNQMNATATTDQHATAESPAFGQTAGTTVKDWTDANKPTENPKPSEGSQDDFRIEDLEKVFPFCIPWDVYYLLSALSADPVAPAIDFPLNFSNFGLDDYRLSVDFVEYEAFAVALRAIEVLGFCVGLALVTRNLIRG